MEMMIPYQNLYVYEISGAISDSKNFFKEDFIGCWNEEKVSFLFFTYPHHDEEVERPLNQESIKTYQRLQEKNWLTHSAAPSSAL